MTKNKKKKPKDAGEGEPGSKKPLGVPGEGDRSRRFASKDVKVKDKTVTI